MENGRLVELVSEMLDELKGTNRRVDGLNDRVDGLNSRVDGLALKLDRLNERVDDMAGDIRIMKGDISQLKKGQAKTNLTLHELRTSVIRLAEGVDRIPDLDRRLTRVEAVVFRQQ